MWGENHLDLYSVGEIQFRMASVSFFTPDICGEENPSEDQEDSHRNPGLSAPYEVIRKRFWENQRIFSGSNLPHRARDGDGDESVRGAEEEEPGLLQFVRWLSPL